MLVGEIRRVCELKRKRGGEASQEGYVVQNTFASYVHAHWASNAQIPRALVAAARPA